MVGNMLNSNHTIVVWYKIHDVAMSVGYPLLEAKNIQGIRLLFVRLSVKSEPERHLCVLGQTLGSAGRHGLCRDVCF